MFGRKKPEARQTVILEGTEVEGHIRSTGNVVIEGVLDGDLATEGAVLIGGSGVVRGNVVGATVSVAGRIEGTVIAHGRLSMLSGGRLIGDAQYGTLEVLRGGVIEGRSTPLGPTSSLPPPLALPASTLPLIDATSSAVNHEARSSSEAPPPPMGASSPSSVPPPPELASIRRTVVRLPPPPPPSNNGAAAAGGATG